MCAPRIQAPTNEGSFFFIQAPEGASNTKGWGGWKQRMREEGAGGGKQLGGHGSEGSSAGEEKHNGGQGWGGKIRGKREQREA